MFYDPATGMVQPTTSKQETNPTNGMMRVRQVAPQAADTIRYVGIHYWLELEGQGPVSDARAFKTGERVRLHVRSNVDGYLQLWALEPTGEGKALFPQEGAVDGFVKADSEYVTPGFIRFAPPAQQERLLVFFTRKKGETPTKLQQSSRGQTSEVAAAQAMAAQGARSLTFETDERTPGQVGTYVVNKEGGPIAREVVLKHQGS
jgi:hypothetical protein